MSALTMGVIGHARKENEKRAPIHPDHLDRIDEALRARMLLESGYADRFGYDDAWLQERVGAVVGRDELFDRSDIILMPKPTTKDFESFREGQVLWGWPHCVQGPAITQLGIDKIRFADPAYRRRFRKDYDKQWGARVWQRDFHDAEIVEAPDASLVGRTIGAVADERGEHPVDTFLDLVVEHGKALRWRTTIANHRPDRLQEIIAHPMVQPGFADSGAHLRNMAFYDFALHVLRMATLDDAPFDAAHAVHKVTGEIADWYGVDAGHLRVGAVADIAVIDPEALDERLDGYHEAEVDVFGGMSRMVRRNEAVRATLIGGRVVWRDGSFAEGFGEGWGTGRFLAPGEATEALALASK